MPEELMNGTDVETIFSDISTMIYDAKNEVMLRVNTSVITLYWNIGKKLSEEVLQGKKPDYGKNIIGDLSERLTAEYGKGFEKSSVFKMVKFYQEFPEYEKVSTLSQQLTWSHFVELLPIEDELKRDFYAVMCKNENWSVRTLRERKKSMLFERTAISKMPEETIANEIAELRDDKKMSLDMFYRDPYMLDFLGLRDTYSEKDLENAILAELEKFILEMGSDFAFLARQKHIVLDGKDYYMDLEMRYNGNLINNYRPPKSKGEKVGHSWWITTFNAGMQNNVNPSKIGFRCVADLSVLKTYARKAAERRLKKSKRWNVEGCEATLTWNYK